MVCPEGPILIKRFRSILKLLGRTNSYTISRTHLEVEPQFSANWRLSKWLLSDLNEKRASVSLAIKQEVDNRGFSLSGFLTCIWGFSSLIILSFKAYWTIGFYSYKMVLQTRVAFQMTRVKIRMTASCSRVIQTMARDCQVEVG